MRSLVRCAVYILITALVLGLLHVWIKNKSYVFDQDTIFDITRKAIAKLNTTGTLHTGNNIIVACNISNSVTGKATHGEIYEEVAKGLEAKYRNHIIPKRDREWIFVNAGGWMAAFYLMHASLTEYVYFMGTAMQTSGHAGTLAYRLPYNTRDAFFKRYLEFARILFLKK